MEWREGGREGRKEEGLRKEVREGKAVNRFIHLVNIL